MTEQQARAVLSSLMRKEASGVREHKVKGWQTWYGHPDGSVVIISTNSIELFESWSDYYNDNPKKRIWF